MDFVEGLAGLLEARTHLHVFRRSPSFGFDLHQVADEAEDLASQAAEDVGEFLKLGIFQGVCVFAVDWDRGYLNAGTWKVQVSRVWCYVLFSDGPGYCLAVRLRMPWC